MVDWFAVRMTGSPCLVDLDEQRSERRDHGTCFVDCSSSKPVVNLVTLLVFAPSQLARESDRPIDFCPTHPPCIVLAEDQTVFALSLYTVLGCTGGAVAVCRFICFTLSIRIVATLALV